MSHHLSRRDADRILDAPGESDAPVGRAIQALRAPGSGSELHREDATVAAFHAARLSPTSRPMSGVATSARSAAVRAVAATGLVVALSSGGFALAVVRAPADPAGPGLRHGHRGRRTSHGPADGLAQRDHDRSAHGRAHRGRDDDRRLGDDLRDHHRRSRRDPRDHVGGRHDRPGTQPRRSLHGVPGQRQVGPRQGPRQRRLHRPGHRGGWQGRHRHLLRRPDR